MISIVAVNCQNDFLETGSFPVANFKATVDKIVRYTEINKRHIHFCYHVMDCHPENHSSFSANGGRFPPHCIQDTHGQKSCLPEELYITSKGFMKTWSNIGLKGMAADGEALEAWNLFDQKYKEFSIGKAKEVDKLIICGNSLDYSVKQTALHLMKQGHKVIVRIDMCTCLGDIGEVLKEYDRNNIPYTCEKSVEPEVSWKVFEGKNYVFIQKTARSATSNGRIIEKTNAISADIFRGKWIVTPEVAQDEIPFDIPDEQYKKAVEILRSQWKKRFGFEPRYEWGENNFIKLKSFVCFPLLPHMLMFNMPYNQYTDLFNEPEMAEMRDKDGLFEHIMRKRYDITPTRTLWKAFLKNPYSVRAFIFLVRVLNFKDMNVINDIIGKEENYYPYLWCFNVKEDGYEWRYRDCTEQFCGRYMERLGERKIVRLLDSAFSSGESRDGLIMFNRLIENNELPDDIERKVLREGFTEYNHRLLIRLNNELHPPYTYKIEYTKFKYTEEEKSLEKDIDGYEFRLAEDSNRLLNISKEMCNCVGHAYQEKAKEHECVIAYVMFKGYYRVCIELIPQTNGVFYLNQCSGYCNERLEGEVLKVCRKWATECRLIDELGLLLRI